MSLVLTTMARDEIDIVACNITHHPGESLNPVSMRRIPPRAIHRGAGDVVVVQGCHDAFAPSLRDKRFTSAILTCHYPIRSLHQFRSQVRNAGSDYAINRELPPCVGDRFRYS